MKTGKDMGIFGGLLAVMLGILVITIGLSLLRYGEYPPPRGAEELGETEQLDAAEIYIIIAATACVLGGMIGFAGGCLANTVPDRAGALMVTGGCLSAFTIIGIISAAALTIGGMRAFKFADAPDGTEPEWEDGEALPY